MVLKVHSVLWWEGEMCLILIKITTIYGTCDGHKVAILISPERMFCLYDYACRAVQRKMFKNVCLFIKTNALAGAFGWYANVVLQDILSSIIRMDIQWTKFPGSSFPSNLLQKLAQFIIVCVAFTFLWNSIQYVDKSLIPTRFKLM